MRTTAVDIYYGNRFDAILEENNFDCYTSTQDESFPEQGIH